MAGTLLTAVSLTLSAFVTSPELLLVYFSLGCGEYYWWISIDNSLIIYLYNLYIFKIKTNICVAYHMIEVIASLFTYNFQLFTNDKFQVVISQVLLTGLGTGLFDVGFLILAQYFDKNHGKANAIFLAGNGLSQFISPLFIWYLQAEYGFTGATMILGALSLHGFLASCLYQPVKWHLKYPKSRQNLSKPKETPLLISSAVNKEDISEENSSHSGPVAEAEESINTQEKIEIQVKCHHRDTKPHGCSSDSKYFCGTSSTPKSPTSDTKSIIPSTDDFLLNSEATELADVKITIRFQYFVAKFSHGIINDLSILKQPTALIISLGTALIAEVVANVAVMVPFAMQVEGHSLQMAAWSVSMAGICNFITRLIVSPLADFYWFNIQLCFIISIAGMALSIASEYIDT